MKILWTVKNVVWSWEKLSFFHWHKIWLILVMPMKKVTQTVLEQFMVRINFIWVISGTALLNVMVEWFLRTVKSIKDNYSMGYFMDRGFTTIHQRTYQQLCQRIETNKKSWISKMVTFASILNWIISSIKRMGRLEWLETRLELFVKSSKSTTRGNGFDIHLDPIFR